MRNTFSQTNSLSESSALALQVDVVDTVTYLGEASIGSATSSAVWRIKKIVETGDDVSITYAGGKFNQVWDNRASLTYA
jgi:hypothetical protein